MNRTINRNILTAANILHFAAFIAAAGFLVGLMSFSGAPVREVLAADPDFNAGNMYAVLGIGFAISAAVSMLCSAVIRRFEK